MSRSSSPPIRRSGADAALAAIDATLADDEVMCFCGCGRLVTRRSPSLYFASMECSDRWHGKEASRWSASVHEMALPALVPTDNVPTALDRLEPRQGTYRGQPIPRAIPDHAEPPTGGTWLQAALRSTVAALRGASVPVRTGRPRRRGSDHNPEALSQFERQQATEMVRATMRDGALLAALEESQRLADAAMARVRDQSWEVTYVDSGRLDDPNSATRWRVRVGTLHEEVVVGAHQRHHEIIMRCVERLRALQNGRLE